MASTSVTSDVHLPDHIWDEIISILGHERHLEPLSLVSKTLLSITNRHKQTLKFFNSTPKFLPSLFDRFPNLKHVSFSQFSNDPLPILLQMADFNFRLETLDLSNHSLLPLQELQKLACSVLIGGLKSFKRCSCSYIYPYNNDLEATVNFFPNLEELELSQSEPGPRKRLWYSRSFDCIHEYGKATLPSKLKRINLSFHHWINDKFLISLSNNCPELEEIVLKKCYNVTEFRLSFVLKGCKNLKTIRLEDMDDAVNYIECQEVVDWEMYEIHYHLCWARNLSEIDFSTIDVSDELLASMAEANLPLKRLTLSRCTRFTYDGITLLLETYHSLDHLSLVDVEFMTDSSICALVKYFKKLRYVNLSRCRKISDSTLFTLMKECPLLETIEMESSNLGRNQGFELNDDVVVKHEQITTLNLSNNENLSNGSLGKIVAACPNLASLKLSSCVAISSEGVGEIMRKCCFLKHLEINFCSKVKNLDLHDTNATKLESLGACGLGLNDRALIDVSKKCANLMFLDLRNCTRLTPEGVLEVVDKCTKLREINLCKCKNMSREVMLRWMRKIYRPTMTL